MRKIYISCPITNNPHHREQMYRAHKDLGAAGWTVVNPLEVGACADETCGGTTFEIGLARIDEFHHSWACYLKYDLRAMLECDAVAMLPNWRKSPGCLLEHHVAASVGMPIYEYDLERRDFKP